MSTPFPQQPSSPDPTPNRKIDPGVLKTLFDFNFDSFITPKIVKIVYIIATVLVGLMTLGMVLSAFGLLIDGGLSTLLGLFLLIAAPVIGIVYLALTRMSMELYYAVIRLSEDVHHGRGRL